MNACVPKGGMEPWGRKRMQACESRWWVKWVGSGRVAVGPAKHVLTNMPARAGTNGIRAAVSAAAVAAYARARPARLSARKRSTHGMSSITVASASWVKLETAGEKCWQAGGVNADKDSVEPGPLLMQECGKSPSSSYIPAVKYCVNGEEEKEEISTLITRARPGWVVSHTNVAE